MGYAGHDVLGAEATRALPVFPAAGRDRVRRPGSHGDWHDVRYADSGRIPDRSWQRQPGWHPPGDDGASLVADWYERWGRFPDDVPGSGY